MAPQGVQRKARWGGGSIGIAALLLCAQAVAAAPKLPLMEARLRAYQPGCSSVSLDDVRAAVDGASKLLEERCRLRLAWQESVKLGFETEFCSLPIRPSLKSKALKRLAIEAKQAHPRELALFLLPDDAGEDERVAWTLVDIRDGAGCASPAETEDLPRFANLFFTDFSWMRGAGRYGEEAAATPSLAVLTLAHEALHALTQRRHPFELKRGALMADHTADMGTELSDDWCDCARQSPYALKVK